MIEYKNSTATLVFNNRGELLLQLRAAHDDSFPSHWDFSAGGGIDEREDAKQSASRELQEELGVTADIEPVSEEHYTYPAWKPDTTREVDLHIFKASHNGPFTPDPHEVDRVEFFSLDTIKQMLAADDKFHPELAQSIQNGLVDKVAP